MPRKSKSTVEGGKATGSSPRKGRERTALPPSSTPSVGGHRLRAAKAGLDLPPADGSLSSSEGRNLVASQAALEMPPLDETIAAIRYWHRQRCFAMEQRKRLDLALGSFLRLMLGWSRDLPDKERAAIAKRAADIVDDPAGTEWEAVVSASVAARTPFASIESRAVKEMSKLAQSLPVWQAFGESVRGFGPASLAVIAAEAGDLANYANPGKLWKRMGLAVMGEVRQGGLAKNASAEAWVEHGYNRQRRSRMWNIGDALIKGNKDEYRALYLARKEYEIARDPEIKPIKAHRRAQRYMEKRLLKKLWQAWRAFAVVAPINPLPANPKPPQGGPQADSSTEPATPLPAATLSADEAERSAIRRMSPILQAPSATIAAT